MLCRQALKWKRTQSTLPHSPYVRKQTTLSFHTFSIVYILSNVVNVFNTVSQDVRLHLFQDRVLECHMADLSQYRLLGGVCFHVHEDSLYIQEGLKPGMPL